MSYIRSGQGHKLLMSPKGPLVYCAEFKLIEAYAEKLEEELDNLRSMNKWPHWQHSKQVRELRAELGEVDKVTRQLLVRDNPEWAAYWGML